MATEPGIGDGRIMKNHRGDEFLQSPGEVKEHSTRNGYVKIIGQEGCTSQTHVVRRVGVHFQFFPGLVVQCYD